MNFQTAIKTCVIDKYASFSGRASRSEYWWFMLAYVIGGVIVSLVGWILYLIYILGLIVPAASVGYRRLQDTGRAGWYIFIPMALALIGMFLAPSAPVVVDSQLTQMPSVGSIGLAAILGFLQLIVGLVFLWWLTRPSQPTANQYGPPPSA